MAKRVSLAARNSEILHAIVRSYICLLYTSDAADE